MGYNFTIVVKKNTEAHYGCSKQPEMINWANTVTAEQLEAAATDPPAILALADRVLGAGATQDCLTRLMSAVYILYVDDPAGSDLVDGLRAIADEGNCEELGCAVYKMLHGMPIAVRDALCYAIRNCESLKCLDIRAPALRQILPLWMAIPQCRTLWSLYYDDAGFVYDHHPQELLQALQVEGFAAELVSFDVSLSPSKSRATHAKLKAVLKHLRQFQKLEKLVILMRSQASGEDIKAMQQFAADPPQALLHFRVRHGVQELKFIQRDNGFVEYNPLESFSRFEVEDGDICHKS
jgi:hypothetical protein